MKIAYNPFLPIGEYIPDGEPHVFGDRVYLFGSHDRENGDTFCMEDYQFYSAPTDDLSDWTHNGVNYRAKQDPYYSEEKPYMFAPDVVQGNDGRLYLYYALAGYKGDGGFDSPISVAVSDKPDGKYEYHGYVKNEDGSIFNKKIPFDPAVINDEGTIRLYFGWGLTVSRSKLPFINKIIYRTMSNMFNKNVEEIETEQEGIMGAFTVELSGDMLTVKKEPKRIVPSQFDNKGTSFEGHAFFEASSIRKLWVCITLYMPPKIIMNFVTPQVVIQIENLCIRERLFPVLISDMEIKHIKML